MIILDYPGATVSRGKNFSSCSWRRLCWQLGTKELCNTVKLKFLLEYQ